MAMYLDHPWSTAFASHDAWIRSVKREINVARLARAEESARTVKG
jgi:hypothetical protein